MELIRLVQNIFHALCICPTYKISEITVRTQLKVFQKLIYVFWYSKINCMRLYCKTDGTKIDLICPIPNEALEKQKNTAHFKLNYFLLYQTSKDSIQFTPTITLFVEKSSQSMLI